MTEGMDLVSLQRRFPLGPWKKLERLWTRLEIEGLLERAPEPTRKVLRLTHQGRLLADGIAQRIYEA